MKQLILLTLLIFASLITKVDAKPLPPELLNTPLEVYQGDDILLKDVVGKKPVYLKFWASWCVPCREQMPHLEHTYQQVKNDIEVVSVNIWINDNEKMIQSTIDEFGLSMPTALDKSGVIAQSVNFIGTPYHILIDEDGDIVHKGHDVTQELDKKIQRLAAKDSSELPAVSISIDDGEPLNIFDNKKPLSVLYFSATWCDWYLKDSRPAMSKKCIAAQKTMNQVAKQLPEIELLGLFTRLWTGEKELSEYAEKYNVEHSVAVDTTNDAFLALGVKELPTLIILKEGKEVFRTTDFESEKALTKTILSFKE